MWSEWCCKCWMFPEVRASLGVVTFLCCDFFVVVDFCRCWRCQLCLSSVRRVIPFRDLFGRFWLFFSSTVYILLSICVAAQFSYFLVTMLFHQSRTNQGSARSYWHRLEPVSSHRVGGGVGGGAWGTSPANKWHWSVRTSDPQYQVGLAVRLIHFTVLSVSLSTTASL